MSPSRSTFSRSIRRRAAGVLMFFRSGADRAAGFAQERRVRAEAAHSFFNADLTPKARAALLELAQDRSGRCGAGAGMGIARRMPPTECRHSRRDDRDSERRFRTPASRSAAGRRSVSIGVADREDVRQGIEALYELGGHGAGQGARSDVAVLCEPYAKYFPPHLDETDVRILARRRCAERLFPADRATPTRSRAFSIARSRTTIFATTLCSPMRWPCPAKPRAAACGMLRKIDSIAHLTPAKSNW